MGKVIPAITGLLLSAEISDKQPTAAGTTVVARGRALR